MERALTTELCCQWQADPEIPESESRPVPDLAGKIAGIFFATGRWRRGAGVTVRVAEAGPTFEPRKQPEGPAAPGQEADEGVCGGGLLAGAGRDLA